MNEQELIEYYNKFNEDKRLKRRHGIVEYITTMKYIKEVLKNFKNPKILDLGAGTGAYSIPLSNDGYDITAFELVKHNLRVIEKNSDKIKCIQGNAIDLSKFSDESFDIVFIFGPLYHLISTEEKIKCLKEAKRVLKSNGIILSAYITNEYAMITHAFKERSILESLKDKKINEEFKITPSETDLYSYLRLEDIDKLNETIGLERIKIIANDTVANYFREYVNKLTDEEFELFIKYHLSICERQDCLGLSTHLLDITKKRV